MKNNICISFLAVLLFLVAPRAEVQADWDWDFTNSAQTHQPDSAIIMEARVWSDSTSSTYDLESSIRYLTYETNDFGAYYDFDSGPSGASHWSDQFEGVTLDPGTSYDFIFGVLEPKSSFIPKGTLFTAFGEINHKDSLSRQFTATVTPEPASMLLMGSGLLAVLGFRRRQ